MKTQKLFGMMLVLAWLAGTSVTPGGSAAYQAGDTVLEIHFDGDVNDSSGNNLNGSWPSGGAQFTTGHLGQAADISAAVDNYVLVNHNALLGGMDKVTLSVWAKKDDADVGGSIVSKHTQYSLAIAGDYVSAYVGNQFGTLSYASKYNLATIHDTEWHHYVLAYDESQVRLWVDDVLQNSTELTGTVAQASYHNLYIGKDPWGDAFEGQIDELTITTDAPDIDAPYLDGYSPLPNAAWVAPNTDIVARVKDDGHGVNSTAITMTVEGIPVTPTITGAPADYTLTYHPPADFAYDQVVDVSIGASDVDGNHVFQAYAFTVRSETDTIPPRGYFYLDDTGTTATTIHNYIHDGESGMGTGAQMRFSNDAITWSAVEPYTATKSWTLASASGVRTVYGRFADASGVWTEAISYTLGNTFEDDLVILKNAPDAAYLQWKPQAGVSEYAVLRSDTLGWKGSVNLLQDLPAGSTVVGVESTAGMLSGDELHFRTDGDAYIIAQVIDAQHVQLTSPTLKPYTVQAYPVYCSGCWVRDYAGYTEVARLTSATHYLDSGLDLEKDYFYVIGYRSGGAIAGYSNPVNAKLTGDNLLSDAALGSNGGYAWWTIRYFGDTPELIDGNPATALQNMAYNNFALRDQGITRFGSYRIDFDAATPLERIEISQDVNPARIRARVIRLGFSDLSMLEFDLESDASITRVNNGNNVLYRIPVRKTSNYVALYIEEVSNAAGDYTAWSKVGAYTGRRIQSPVTSAAALSTTDISLDFSQPAGTLPALLGTDEVWTNVDGDDTNFSFQLTSWPNTKELFNIYRVQTGDVWPHQYAKDIIKIGELAEDISASATSLVLTHVTPYLDELSYVPLKVDLELMYLVSRSGGTLTVSRGQSHTPAVAHQAGDPVYTYKDAGQLLRLQEAIPEFKVVKYSDAYVAGLTPIDPETVPLTDTVRTATLTLTVMTGTYSVGDVIRIGREAFQVISVDASAPPQIYLTVRRGFDGTNQLYIQHNGPTGDVYKLLNYEPYYVGFKNDAADYNNYYWDNLKTTFDRVIQQGDAIPWIIVWSTWYSTQARGRVASLETLTNTRGIQHNVIVDEYNSTHDDADWWYYVQPGLDLDDDTQIMGNMYEFYHAELHILTGAAAGKVFFVRSHSGDRLRVVRTWEDSTWPVENPQYVDLYAEGVRPGDAYIVTHSAHKYGNVARKYWQYNANVFYNIARFIRTTYSAELGNRPIYMEHYLEPNLQNYGTWTKDAYIGAYQVFARTLREGSSTLGPGFPKSQVIIGAGSIAGSLNAGVKITGDTGDYDFALSLIEQSPYLDFISYHRYYLGNRMYQRELSWEIWALRNYAQSLGKDIVIIDSEGNTAANDGTGSENAVHTAALSVPYWLFNFINSYDGSYGAMGRLDFDFHFRLYGSGPGGMGLVIADADGLPIYDLPYWLLKMYRERTSTDMNAPDTLARTLKGTDKYAWVHAMGTVRNQTGQKLVHLSNRKPTPVTVTLSLVGVTPTVAYMDSVVGCGPHQTIQDGYHPITLTGVIVRNRIENLGSVVLEPCSANVIVLEETLSLMLQGHPADEAIHLTWEVGGSLPPTSTWRIVHVNQLDLTPVTINNIVSTTRAYELENLTNDVLYTVTLNAMLDAAPILSDTVSVTPEKESAVLFLPLVMKGGMSGPGKIALAVVGLAACLAVLALRRV